MGLAGVRTPQENDIRVFDLSVRVGSATGAEYRRQTDDAWGMSSPVAAVDVVAADYTAGELLRQVVHFVAGFRTAEHAERVRTMAIDSCPEAAGSPIEGFVPASFAQTSTIPHERPSDSLVVSSHV